MSNLVGRFFRHGLPYVMLSNVAQQGVAFLTVIFVAKFLAPDEFALVRLAMAYVAIATVLAVGGVTAPILRYCADVALLEPARCILLGVGVRRVLATSLAVLAAALTGIAWWQLDPLQARVYAAYALQLPGLAVASLVLVYLQAVQRFKTLAFYQVAIRLAAFVFSVAAVYWHGLTGLLVAAVLVAYLACIPLVVLSRPKWRTTTGFKAPEDFSSLAFYSVFGTVVTTMGQYADLIILDVVGTQKEMIAVYSLATVFFFAAMAFGGAVQSVATPMFTTLMNDPVMFKKRLMFWSLMLSAGSIPLAVAMVLLAKVVEIWFLGCDYTGLVNILSILMIKFFVWSTFAVGGAALVGIGAIKQGAWIAVLTTLLTGVIGLPLCKHYGIYGAAWTQVVVTIASTFLIWWVILIEMRALKDRVTTVRGKNA